MFWKRTQGVERQVCRLCDESGGSLESYCVCKSDGVPIVEHEKCVLKALGEKPLLKDLCCSVCKQHYTVTTRFNCRLLFSCAFEYAWKPVLAVLLLKLLLLFAQPQLQFPHDSKYIQGYLYIAVQFVLLLTKLAQDLRLCKMPSEKDVVVSVLLLYIPCFLLLQWVEFGLLRILPEVQSGFVLLFSHYNIRASLYDFVPLSNAYKEKLSREWRQKE